MYGNFELRNEGINRVQCIDGEIQMSNIRDRDMKYQMEDVYETWRNLGMFVASRGVLIKSEIMVHRYWKVIEKYQNEECKEICYRSVLFEN